MNKSVRPILAIVRRERTFSIDGKTDFNGNLKLFNNNDLRLYTYIYLGFQFREQNYFVKFEKLKLKFNPSCDWGNKGKYC